MQHLPINPPLNLDIYSAFGMNFKASGCLLILSVVIKVRKKAVQVKVNANCVTLSIIYTINKTSED